MPLQPIPIATQSYWLESAPATSERLINMFAEKLPDGARSKAIVRSTHGLTLAYTVGTGPIYTMNGDYPGRTYVVSGTHAFRMKPDNESLPEDLGDIGATISSGSTTTRPSHPTIAVGTNGVVFCAPPNAYYIGHNDPAGNLIKLDFSSSPAAGASSVAYIDGYFVFTSFDGTLFFCTNLLDLTFNGLYYAKADAKGDLVTLVINQLGELWFFGSNSITVWYDAGTANFPFAQREGVEIPYTLSSTRTVAQLHGSVYWVTNDGLVVQVSGYQVTKISTPWVEEYLRANTGQAFADAFAYNHGGHDYFCITVTSQQVGNYGPDTLVFDFSTGLWHERQTGTTTVYTGLSAALRSSAALIGDRYTGNMYRADEENARENSQNMLRTMICPPLWAGGARAFMGRLEVEVGMGSALTTQGLVRLDISDDGGYTYRNRNPNGDLPSFGYPAVRTGRVYWTRCGSFRQRVLKLTFNDRCSVYALDADIVAGAS